MSIIITDPELVQILEEQAKTHNSTVEAVLKEAFVPKPSVIIAGDEAEAIRQTMHKIYNMARRYWLSVGDNDRANMTDDELAKKFGAFDENGIPRFKDELPAEPPVGSGAYVAKIIAETSGVIIDEPLNEPIDLTNMKDIMGKEFGDYLHKRMNGDYDE